MSWNENLENIKFTIRTGDGKIYEPLFNPGDYSFKFNTFKSDYINVNFSYIHRKTRQSSAYPIVFYFQGEGYIEKSNEFIQSCSNRKTWLISHPYYGEIKGQPTSVKRSDKQYNITEFTVEFWETVGNKYPQSKVSSKDDARTRVNSLNTTSLGVISANSKPLQSDIPDIKDQIGLVGSKFSPKGSSFAEYKRVIETAKKDADSLVDSVEEAYPSIQNVLSLPATYSGPAFGKVESYIEALKVLKESVGTVFAKNNYESQGASSVAGICDSCLNPEENEYVTRADVERMNYLVLDSYNDYLTSLDTFYVDDLGTNPWQQNYQIQSDLSELVFLTLNELFLIGFNAKQEIIYELKKDSNIIIETHKYIGLDDDDQNIDFFRETNNIRMDELFLLKKGRELRYFV